ncbi:hypothetical protein Goklo_024522 [Gossypium klotzschianum]|uniref:Uncharacterized protein n=1 Tax=Gossypium klotzschianum TaxID=34286 RepID=A0A7J8W5H6_9ROSI|nr:hypothetical protein [Gossypium klotzschianum]
MFFEAKMWIQFVCTRIVPTVNGSNINTFQATLLNAILYKKQASTEQSLKPSRSIIGDTLFQ